MVASLKLSCCRTSKTPTLAKSRACCETVKAALVVAAAALVAVVAVDINTGVVVAGIVEKLAVVEGTQLLVMVRVIVTVVVGWMEVKPMVNVVVVD